jgi:predicted secreted protein
MSALVGRKVVITRGAGSSPVAVGILGARNKTMTMNGEPVDVTSDDDSGYRTLLETDAGQKSVDLSIEGITKDGAFLSDITNDAFVDSYEILITGIGTLAGMFFVVNAAITGPYNEASGFSAEFQSTGVWTFTPAV